MDLTLLTPGADYNPGRHVSRTVIGEHAACRGAFIVRVWTDCQQGHGLRGKSNRGNHPVYRASTIYTIPLPCAAEDVPARPTVESVTPHAPSCHCPHRATAAGNRGAAGVRRFYLLITV